MILQPDPKKISQILASGLFQVPSYQREYAWSEENVETLWDDILNNESDRYFVGAIIVYRSRSTKSVFDRFMIVDGQQRLATLTMMLAVIREHYKKNGFGSQALSLQKYIAAADEDDRPQFIFNGARYEPYFPSVVQQYDTTGLTWPERPSPAQRRILKAYNFLDRAVQNEVDLAKKRKASAATVKKRLQELARSVLNLESIFVIVSTQNEAVTVFETLNARGVDLTLADLIRSHLMKDAGSGVKIDEIAHRFQSILASLEAPGTDLSPQEFFFHSWLSRYTKPSGAAVTAKKVYPLLTKATPKRADKLALLDQFEADKGWFIAIRKPERESWPGHLTAASRSLEALRLFRMKQPTPLLMSVFRAYDSKLVDRKTLESTLKALEIFHFKYTAISEKSSSGRVSNLYAQTASKVADISGAGKEARKLAKKHLTGLVDELRKELPSEAEFASSFAALRYGAESSDKGRLISYIFHEMGAEYGGAHLAGLQLEIEHLAPQNPSGSVKSQLPTEYVESIGNLLLLTPPLNKRLGNKDFTTKRALLEEDDGANGWVDSLVLSGTQWGVGEIEERRNQLAKDAFNSVWGMTGDFAI